MLRQFGAKPTTISPTPRRLQALQDGLSEAACFRDRMRHFQFFCGGPGLIQMEFTQGWLKRLDLRTYQRYLKDGPPTRPEDLRGFRGRLKRAIRKAGLQDEEEACLRWLLDGVAETKKAPVAAQGTQGTTEAVACQDSFLEANSPAPDLFTGPGPWEELPEATTLAELRDFIRESGLHLSDLKSSGTLAADDLNLVARTALHCIPPTMSLSDGIEHVDYIQETVWRWAGLECDHGDERTRWAAKANLRRCRRALADLFRPLARNDEESLWLDEFFIPGPTLAGFSSHQDNEFGVNIAVEGP